jgi:hypothetical protein
VAAALLMLQHRLSRSEAASRMLLHSFPFPLPCWISSTAAQRCLQLQPRYVRAGGHM